MKVSDLDGAMLDYFVAKTEGYEVRMESGRILACLPREEGYSEFSPSSKWPHGGPIIERNRISVSWFDFLIWESPHEDIWLAHRLSGPNVIGKTPLIAAMRLNVIDKFGDEVEPPVIEGI